VRKIKRHSYALLFARGRLASLAACVIACGQSRIVDGNDTAVADTIELSDDFERANASGLGALGHATTGQLWTLTGPGGSNGAIESGRYTDGPQATADAVYAYMHLSHKPRKIRFRFSFVPLTGGIEPVIAVASSSDATLDIANLHALHFVSSATFYYLTLDNGAGYRDLASGVAFGAYTRPLVTDGTEYECTIAIEGDTVTITLPDGQTFHGSDPLISDVTGKLVFFEHYYTATSSLKSRFESVQVTY